MRPDRSRTISNVGRKASNRPTDGQENAQTTKYAKLASRRDGPAAQAFTLIEPGQRIGLHNSKENVR